MFFYEIRPFPGVLPLCDNVILGHIDHGGRCFVASKEPRAENIVKHFQAKVLPGVLPIGKTPLEVIQIVPQNQLGLPRRVTDWANRANIKLPNPFDNKSTQKVIPASSPKNTVEAVFENLLGVEELCRRVEKIMNGIELSESIIRDGGEIENPFNNFMVIGPPGVGKTTVAEKIGKVFESQNRLRAGKRAKIV